MSRLFQNETLRYTTGFVVSLILSFSAYELVITKQSGAFSLVAFILLVLAGLQMIVQVILFLHVGSEQKPRWQSYTYIFTWLMVLVIVIGSIWIMRNLDYNMRMDPQQVNTYMFNEAKKGF